MRAEVCISVLNWNGWHETRKCLDSLVPLLRVTPAQVVVCDNASDDDSWACLQSSAQQHFPDDFLVYDQQQDTLPPPPEAPLILLRTPRNGGFSAGHNAVLRYRLEFPGARYFWLLNNDLELAPDALQALLACAGAQPDTGMFGSSVFDAARPEILQCAGGCRYYPWLTLFRPVGGGATLDRVEPGARLDYVYGAAMFIRRECFAQVGLLNEDYFLFYEELDFTQRIRHAGYKIAWCRDSRVWHQGSATVGKPEEGNRDKLIRANYYENLSTLKYTARFHPFQFLLAAPLRLGLKALAVSLRGQFFLLGPLWRAYRDFAAAFLPRDSAKFKKRKKFFFF